MVAVGGRSPTKATKIATNGAMKITESSGRRPTTHPQASSESANETTGKTFTNQAS